jgi:sodium transport system permease protein
VNTTDVVTIFRREVRGALRERLIVVNSLVLPVVLYPAILWLVFSAFAFVQGLSERATSRIALGPPAAGHEALRDSIAALPNVVSAEGAVGDESALRSRDVDATVAFVPAGSGGVRVVVGFDGTWDGGRLARDRIADAVERYRRTRFAELAAARGAGRAALEPFDVARTDLASGAARGAATLAEVIPLFLVIMVALGCFMPAIDATAGERERSTWETTMTVAASRGSILTGKYLYVATMGTAAGLLNVAGVGLTLAPLVNTVFDTDAGGQAFALPLRALPVILLGTTSLALFFAAAMMILASFARTFKDGQSMITPIYWLALLPILLGASPDQTLTPALAFIPIANVAIMTADAIRGSIDVPLVALVLAVELASVVLCLWIARRILAFEDLLVGSYAGSFFRFARERLGRRRAGDRI